MTNIDDDMPIIYSPLNRTVSRNGKSVEVEIYRAENEEWILEVVDEYGNSTVWDDLFPTDQAALDEATRAIDEEGIDAMIDPDELNQALDGLSDIELHELECLLADESIASTSMDLAMLDGYLSAIAIGPGLIAPSVWLPRVWDHAHGRAGLMFAQSSHANRVLSLLMRHYNAVVTAFNTGPAGFEPLFVRGAQYGAAPWSDGFLCGLQFNERAWSLLAAQQPAWFAPFMHLRTENGVASAGTQGDAGRWVEAIMPSLIDIAGYWKSPQAMPAYMPIVRATAKVGRNDPCPCGSGRKAKKCCSGKPAAPSTLH